MFQYPETRDIAWPEYSHIYLQAGFLKEIISYLRDLERTKGNCAVYSVFPWISSVMFYYPEIKAAEIIFSSDLDPFICSFYIRIHNTTGGV